MENLNIRLLRKGRSAQGSFKSRFLGGGSEALIAAPWAFAEGATAYYGQIFNKPPKWIEFLRSGAGEVNEELLSSGAGAVIFIKGSRRTFAICLGHIHIALDDDAFERQFGLKVVLNSVQRNSLRTLDLATPDAVTFQKRIQASRDSDLYEFGVDMLRDLARVAGGTPVNTAFAKFVAGKDALSITCDADSQSLKDKCKEIEFLFNQVNYKKEFSWVDNLRVVDEADLLDSLNGKLFFAIKEIRAGRISELHLAPPEVVNYMDGSDLHYNGFGSYGATFTDLDIVDYAKELDKAGFAGSIEDIKKNHRISARPHIGGAFSEKWKIYDCFIFETTLGSKESEKQYVLFSGEWYLVSKKFKESVEDFFDKVEKVKIIGSTNCVNEQELIESVDKSRPDLFKLDQVKINPSGTTHAFIEPCDFLSIAGDFIHLKDGHSSGPISHLWAQGVVSAECLVRDGEFRDKLKSKVTKSNFKRLIPTKNSKVDRSKFKVVYGIMRRRLSSGQLDIPFFSKVSFQSNVENIQKMGIDVAVEIIEKI